MDEEEFKRIDIKNKIIRNSFYNENKVQYYKNQNYHKLKSECLESNKLFEDPYFLPTSRNVFYIFHLTI